MNHNSEQKSLGVYIAKEYEALTYDLIKSNFPQHTDFVVFSDIVSGCTDVNYSCLPSFYMYFYNHDIVFFDAAHIDLFSHKMISDNIYLFTEGKCEKYELR
jgi:hypothetical protein